MSASPTDLTHVLSNVLPDDLHRYVPSLVRYLTTVVAGGEQSTQGSGLPADIHKALLQALAGQQIAWESYILTFGDHAQLGVLHIQEQAQSTVRQCNLLPATSEHVGNTVSQGQVSLHDTIFKGVVVGQNSGTLNATIIEQWHASPPDEVELPPHIPSPPPPVQPPVVPHFVGRTQELTYFKTQLATEHLAVITGMAGTGKTTLATALAYQMVAPEQIFWHQCYPSSGCGELLEHLIGFLAWHGHDALWQQCAVASHAGGQVPSLDTQIDYLVHALQGHQVLLYLDDIHYIDTDAAFLHFLDGIRPHLAAGTISLLLTSRRVPSFTRVSACKPLEGLSLADTQTLLTTQSLTLDSSLITALHQTTGGNPELLLLALNALQDDSHPTTLIRQLATHADVAQYLMMKVHTRLVDDQRAIQVMRALAILQGYPGTRDALEAILDQDGVWEILHQLEQRYLVTKQQSSTGEPRYTQHALVQTFYYQQVGRRERRRLHLRAGQYYEHDEPDSMRAALHFEQAEAYEQALNLITMDVWGLINRGHAQTLSHLLARFRADQVAESYWIKACIAKAEVATFLRNGTVAHESYQTAYTLITTRSAGPMDHRQYARICQGMGELLEFENPQAAIQWLRQGLDRLHGESPAESGPLYLRLGAVLVTLADYSGAQQALEMCLRYFQQDQLNQRAQALTCLGVLHCAQSQFEQGKNLFTQVVQIYRHTHNYWALLSVWQNLLILRQIRGAWNTAVTEYSRALALAERLHHGVRQTELTLNFGILKTKQGDFAAAQTLLARSLALAQRYQLSVTTILTQLGLVDLAIRSGDWDAAARILEDIDQLTKEVEVKDQLSEIYRTWSLIYLARMDLPHALTYAEQAVAQARALGDKVGEGMSLRVLGQVQAANGYFEQAYANFKQSLVCVEDDVYEAARTRMHWGTLLVRNTPDDEGVALLQDAHKTFTHLGAAHDLSLVQPLLEET